MKLHVPFRMPETAVTRSPVKLARSARRIGIPPATAASMPRPAPFSRASACRRGPVPGEKHLVRRHDALARAERGADEAVRRLDPAQELDDEVDAPGRSPRTRDPRSSARRRRGFRPAFGPRPGSRRRPERGSRRAGTPDRAPPSRAAARTPDPPCRSRSGRRERSLRSRFSSARNVRYALVPVKDPPRRPRCRRPQSFR